MLMPFLQQMQQLLQLLVPQMLLLWLQLLLPLLL
jgi:hypothetical protein